jgi:hypothetical protein
VHYAPKCIGMIKCGTVRYMGCVAIRWRAEGHSVLLVKLEGNSPIVDVSMILK